MFASWYAYIRNVLHVYLRLPDKQLRSRSAPQLNDEQIQALIGALYALEDRSDIPSFRPNNSAFNR